MKHILTPAALTGILLSALPVACTSSNRTADADNVEPWDRLPMSMYIWHASLADSADVERIDFDNYDIVYLMDRAFWNSPEHFVANADSVLANPGATVPLSKPDRFRQAVDRAHDQGAIALWSTGNELIYGALDDDLSQKMVGALTRTVDEIGFDGIDVDWEIGIHNNLDRHAKLLTDLRHSLDSLGERNGRKYYLTTALSVELNYPDSVRQQLNDAVDHVNLMSYDIGGCLWRNYATHNTALDVIADAVERNWHDTPSEKLHLGLASYGFIYTGIMPGEVLPEGHNIGEHGRFTNYNYELPKIYGSNKWRRVYEEGPDMYYFIAPDSSAFVTMEVPETVIKKFVYADKAGLGGTFWWEFEKDIVSDKTGSGKWQHTLVPDHKQTGRYTPAK